MKLRNRLLLFFMLGLFVVAAFGLATMGYLLQRPLQMEEPTRVDVPSGSSLSGVLYRLQGQDLLGDGSLARYRRLAARVYALGSDVDERMHVGEYQLQPGDSLYDFLGKLERGDVFLRSLTLVEGWNMRDVRRHLKAAEALEHRLPGMDDAALMAALGRPDLHPEGWFAPNTYFYTRGETDLALLRRALRRQEESLEQAWAERVPELPFDEPYEALVLASIIEKETSVPDERREIAGVFVNRLRQGMRLQTDPTVIYGLGETYDGNIRRSDLQRDTPYNTYRRSGLPPTPIAMPGEASIRAAVDPAETSALYFVARGDGSHYFSETLEEHQQAVRRYQLRRRKDYRSTPAPVEGEAEEADTP